MQDISQIHDNNRDYLNTIVVPYNGLELEINALNKNLKKIYSDCYLENIAKIHRDKCVELHYMFENVNFNSLNSIKGSIFKMYADLVDHAGYLLIEICKKINKQFADGKKIDDVKIQKETLDEIDSFNEICLYIRDYEIKDNLEEIFTYRYNSIDIEKFRPKVFVTLYKLDKTSIKELGYLDEFSKIEESIDKYINEKIKESNTYWEDFDRRAYRFLKYVLDDKKENIK